MGYEGGHIMRIMHSAITVTVLLLASTGLGQIDPATMGIGIYFDPEGLNHCVSGLSPGEYGPGFVYLLITRPDPLCQEYGVSGWECELQIEGPLTVLDWGLPPGAVNASTPPVFYVGHPEPLPFSPAAVLLDMQVALTGIEPVNFQIHPAPIPSLMCPLPVAVCACDLCEPQCLPVSTGLDENDEPNVCATINGDCPTPNQATTWGDLKALFR
jgi:hypothetical protein